LLLPRASGACQSSVAATLCQPQSKKADSQRLQALARVKPSTLIWFDLL
jgi:hypothetical protein